MGANAVSKYDDLILKTAQLATAAPAEWEMFLKAFGEFSTSVASECVMSSPLELSVNQGRARMTAWLKDTFSTAVIDAGRIRNGRTK